MPTRTRRFLESRTLVPACVLATAFLGSCGAPDDSEPDVESVTSELTSEDCEKPARILSTSYLGRYATGIVGFESSGETAALRHDRLYVTSAAAAPSANWPIARRLSSRSVGWRCSVHNSTATTSTRACGSERTMCPAVRRAVTPA